MNFSPHARRLLRLSAAAAASGLAATTAAHVAHRFWGQRDLRDHQAAESARTRSALQTERDDAMAVLAHLAAVARGGIPTPVPPAVAGGNPALRGLLDTILPRLVSPLERPAIIRDEVPSSI